MTEELEVDLGRFLGQLVECYSKNGEFNQHTAPMGTVEIREEAERLLKAMEAEDDE